jgi:trans-aconitate methyltransferase
VLAVCYRSLRNSGRMGIQAPATAMYCPAFVRAIREVAADERTKEVFSSFRAPWVFLESAQAYRALFEQVGFKVQHAEIVETTNLYGPDEVLGTFNSGAAAGYLNPDYYDALLTDRYLQDFAEIVQESFIEQADKNGKIELLFNRIYLLADKRPAVG